MKPGQGRGRIEDQPRLAAVIADERQGAVDVVGPLGMEGDEIGARLGEVGHQAVDRTHHEVHIDGDGDVGADRLADQRADGEVGDEMVVHHVEMQQIGTSGLHRPDLLAEPGEIGRQQTGSNSTGARRCVHVEEPAWD